MITNLISCQIGMPQLIVILVIVLLLFGGRKIPELMKGVGKGVRAYKEGLNELEKDMNETDKKATEAKKAQPDETSEPTNKGA